MKYSLITIIIFLISCKTETAKTNEYIIISDQKSNTEFDDLAALETDYRKISIVDIPKEWEMITYKNNKEIVYYPCDKGNFRYKIERKNGDWILVEFTGIEVSYFAITNTLLLENELLIICN